MGRFSFRLRPLRRAGKPRTGASSPWSDPHLRRRPGRGADARWPFPSPEPRPHVGLPASQACLGCASSPTSPTCPCDRRRCSPRRPCRSTSSAAAASSSGSGRRLLGRDRDLRRRSTRSPRGDGRAGGGNPPDPGAVERGVRGRPGRSLLPPAPRRGGAGAAAPGPPGARLVPSRSVPTRRSGRRSLSGSHGKCASTPSASGRSAKRRPDPAVRRTGCAAHARAARGRTAGLTLENEMADRRNDVTDREV